MRSWLPRVMIGGLLTHCPWDDVTFEGRYLLIRWGSLMIEIGLSRRSEP